MGFGAAVSSAFRNFATFQGRAGRSEYWWWVLFVVVGNALLGGPGLGLWHLGLRSGQMSESGLAGVFAFVTLLPTLAVTWRRLHDTDRSGGWFFIQIIPVIGTLVLIVFAVQEGTRGPNRFGADPRRRERRFGG